MQPEVAKQAVELQPVGAGRWSLRLRGAALLIPCLGVFGLAQLLAPRASGHGTHENLGLPPCAFLSRTGWPCPSCGLTTSFAAVAHGQFRRAFLAHPFGPLFFLALGAVGLCGLGEVLFGRDVLRFLRPGLWWAVVLLAGMLGGWGFKIAHGMMAGTLPIR